jgi:hypothetical protein
MTGQVKRTYVISDEADVAVKIKAANDHVHPSDVVQKAIELYCGLKKK